MESSTGHAYYRDELITVTKYSGHTIDAVMRPLHAAGLVDRRVEYVTETTNRPARILYTLTPEGVRHLRLEPEKT